MNQIWKHKTFLFVVAGTALALLSVLLPPIRDYSTWGVCTSAVICLVGLVFLNPDTPPDPLEERLRDFEQQRRDFDEWKTGQADALQQQSHRIEERNRDLLERSARFQEFAEYPAVQFPHDSHEAAASALRLSDKDREINELLEKEAERVYEKIRNDGYTADGHVVIDEVLSDALSLIRKVAAVYSPDSRNPVLETSFEQLARAASRICLHTLVLLEQLPLDVQQYNINELHSYVRKAVKGYGAYQQVAPWLTNLTRAAYVGRIAAGANPVTLGAWWLATELGRRGARKVVENVVDRQAIAVLHDVVTVIGTEVANIYGPGYRQRDAAWVYGTELVELLSRFPVSRDSLAQALREITALPLRSEYDRIYLYRCVANHRAAGIRLEDPAILSRSERESVAGKLEAFYSAWIHGKTDEARMAWQSDVESRLDLKLRFSEEDGIDEGAAAAEAVQSVHAFLVSVLDCDPATAASLVEDCDLMTRVPLADRKRLLVSLKQRDTSVTFEPPDLDPASELTEGFLQSLYLCALKSPSHDVHIEELLLETACYFRRTRVDAAELLHRCVMKLLAQRCSEQATVAKLPSPISKQLLRELKSGESVLAVYTDVQASRLSEHDPAALVVIGSQSPVRPHRIVLLNLNAEQPLWESTDATRAVRRRGMLIDSCELHGGKWSDDGDGGTPIVVAGAISGGGFLRYFRALLAASLYSEKT